MAKKNLQHVESEGSFFWAEGDERKDFWKSKQKNGLLKKGGQFEKEDVESSKHRCLFNYVQHVQLSMTLGRMHVYICDENKEPPVKYEIWFKATLGLSDLCF